MVGIVRRTFRHRGRRYRRVPSLPPSTDARLQAHSYDHIHAPAPPRPSSDGSACRSPSPSSRPARWDAIVVGAGHNGLTCAAYLARAGPQGAGARGPGPGGRRLHAWRSRGPACGCLPAPTSPGCCIRLVIRELRPPRPRLPLDAGGRRALRAVRGRDQHPALGRRRALRGGDRALRAEGPRRVAGDAGGEAPPARRAPARRRRATSGSTRRPTATRSSAGCAATARRARCSSSGPWSRWSSATWTTSGCTSRYLGQGVIGTNASPHDPGHRVGVVSTTPRAGCSGSRGRGATSRAGWGWSRSSSATSPASSASTVAAGVPVARILPGEGVELASGERIRAPHVISNADPAATLRLLGDGGRRGLGGAGPRGADRRGSR